MGCNFTWQGSIPEPERQVRAVALYREFFDPAHLWPVVCPEPTATARLVAGRFGGSSSAALGKNEQRIVDAQPLKFFGVAPYLERGYPPQVLGRGQLVFDRAAGGRLVSIIDSARVEPDLFPGVTGRCVRCEAGGKVRLLSDAQGLAYALFLALLRRRFAAELETADDRGYIDRAESWLRQGDRTERAAASHLNVRHLCAEMVWDLRPKMLGEDCADKNPITDRLARFDFLPLALQAVVWSLPRDEASRRRHALHLLAMVCLESDITAVDPDASAAQLFLHLRKALYHVRLNSDSVTVVDINLGLEPECFLVLDVSGGQATQTDVPLADVRVMLSRIRTP